MCFQDSLNLSSSWLIATPIPIRQNTKGSMAFRALDNQLVRYFSEEPEYAFGVPHLKYIAKMIRILFGSQQNTAPNVTRGQKVLNQIKNFGALLHDTYNNLWLSASPMFDADITLTIKEASVQKCNG